ncbi:hypothetical protein SR870_19800 [Rhodopseudomonas palustris]|uniref:hypothetical protein n=1 Tax=Rhodopseudomonas palustris TaxID=1076 RepID=UPI002ACEF39F|nr:hypothetical protein [Rhodopseudomonas palustris]WQG98903.1 hypothetical protein SR870_19800 [Rhodopseudomonas palustris]
MQNWFVALAVAVLIVIGFAAGPMSVVVAFLSFWVTLYLVWAYELGFKDTWARYGLNRVKPPFWAEENKVWFYPIFGDRVKVVKAAAVALLIVAFSLMLPVSVVRIATLVVLAWYVTEIYRAQKNVDQLDRARFN